MGENVKFMIDKSKRNNFLIIGIAEEKNGKGEGWLMGEIIENFPDHWREAPAQIQEAQRTPNKID